MTPSVAWPLTIDRTLRSNAEHYGDREAVKFGDRTLTYRELDASISKFANGLRRVGLRRGDLVLVLLPNSIEHVVVMFGIQRAGGAYVSCSTAYPPDEVAYQLVHSEAAVAVTIPERAAELRAIADEADRSLKVIVVGAPSERALDDDFTRMMAQESADADDLWAEPDQPGIIFYTSGTTARPKGVVWSNAACYTAARRGCDAMAYSFGERVLHFFPMHHSMGGAAILTPPMLVAGTLVMLAKFSASGFIPTVIKEQITMTSLNATHVKILLATPESVLDRAHALSRSQFGLTLDSPRRRAFTERFGIRLVGFYGSTEAVGIAMATPLYSNYSPTAVGLPMPELEARVIDAVGNDVAPGQPGELLFRSLRADALCMGYHKDPTATAKLFREGWMHTGDIVSLDSDGYFNFVDRIKDMIKSSGYNV